MFCIYFIFSQPWVRVGHGYEMTAEWQVGNRKPLMCFTDAGVTTLKSFVTLTQAVQPIRQLIGLLQRPRELYTFAHKSNQFWAVLSRHRLKLAVSLVSIHNISRNLVVYRHIACNKAGDDWRRKQSTALKSKKKQQLIAFHADYMYINYFEKIDFI